MIRNSQRLALTGRVPQAHVAATLPDNFIAKPAEGDSGFSARNSGKRRHLGSNSDSADQLAAGVGDLFAVGLHVFDRQSDRVACIGKRLFHCVTLAVTTGERWNNSHIPTVGVWLQDNIVASLRYIAHG